MDSKHCVAVNVHANDDLAVLDTIEPHPMASQVASPISFPSEGSLPNLDDVISFTQKPQHIGTTARNEEASGPARQESEGTVIAQNVSLRVTQRLFDWHSESHAGEVVRNLNDSEVDSRMMPARGSQFSIRKSLAFASEASIFNKEFSEELAAEDPATHRFLMRTAFGRLTQVTLVAVNIVISAGTILVQSAAMKADPAPQGVAILLVYYVLSVVVGCMMFMLNIRSNGGLSLFSLNDFVKVGALSLIFAPANLFNLLAFGTSLGAGTIVVIGTLRLPLMAAVSTVFLNKVYKVTSYVSLMVVALCACTVFLGAQQLAKVAHDREAARSPEYLACQGYSNVTASGTSGDEGVTTCSAAVTVTIVKDNYLQGLIFTALSIGLSIVGNTLAERLLKKSDKPVYIHLIYTSLASIIVNIPMSFIVPLVFQADEPERRWWAATTVVCADGSEVTIGGGGLLTNWGSFATLTAILKVVKFVTSMLILKKMSAIVRTLGSNMALILVVLYGELFTKLCWADEMPINMYANMLVLVLCVFQFSIDSGRAVGD
eukprot:TRINITY_DN69137_c0_g1_i1.p1 TRINITY_DN69137_c0_g1~~TRINITY_DN69137_c0_g1_i1.p1  ORF type:complete len:545 (+),score=78.06 TRINITY_DN69137_c0_g1_i1:47-1681(+)